MKKFLLFFLFLHSSLVFAQKQDFFFPQNNWEEYEQVQKNIFAELNHYKTKVKLSKGEQEQLSGIQEKKEIQKGEEQLLFDFNKDSRWDLLLVKGTYFGPSPGFQFYANTEKGIEFICENSGDIWEIKKTSKYITFYYLIPIIDSGESNILYIINLDLKKQGYSFKKLYYAQQTILPQDISSKPRKSKLEKKTSLRFSPEIKDKGLWKDIENSEESYSLSKFIKGNIVAYYDKGSEYLILSKEGDWQFVAFLPKYKPSENSLSHGMDAWEKININAYVCAWIMK